MHRDTFKQDNYNTVRGNGGCRVSEVQASTTFPMPDHKGFKLQCLSEIRPLHFEVNFQKFCTLRVNIHSKVYVFVFIYRTVLEGFLSTPRNKLYLLINIVMHVIVRYSFISTAFRSM